MGGLEGVVALVLALLIQLGHGLGDAEGLGVEWGLGDKTVGERKPEDSGYARG